MYSNPLIHAASVALVLTTAAWASAADREIPGEDVPGVEAQQVNSPTGAPGGREPESSEASPIREGPGATAVELPPLEVGQRIRLRAATVRPGRFVAVVNSQNDNELAISTEVELAYQRKAWHDVIVPIAQVTSVEVSRGRDFRWKRVWIGAAVGLVGGAALGTLDNQSFSDRATTESVQFWAIVGLGIGAATGAIPWEQWERVWPPP